MNKFRNNKNEFLEHFVRIFFHFILLYRYKDDCPCSGYSNRHYCLDDWAQGSEGKSISWRVIRSQVMSNLWWKYKDYSNSMVKSVENYWRPQVILNGLPNWQKLHDQVVTKLQDYEDVRAVEKSEVLSTKSKAKLYVARERRRKIGEEWNKKSPVESAQKPSSKFTQPTKPKRTEL